jgi:hypothetical protein
MNEPRATFNTSDEPSAHSVPSHDPPGLTHLAGRFLFCGLSRHAVAAIVSALGGLTVALQSFATEAAEHHESIGRMLAEMHEIIGPPSKRFMWRHLAHESIRLAELVLRMKPPLQPHWLIRHAPWARRWSMTLPRGQRRTRAWT